jgi:hypothetical protein
MSILSAFLTGGTSCWLYVLPSIAGQAVKNSFRRTRFF